MNAVAVQPFVAVLSRVPLLTGAIVDRPEGIVMVRAFTTQDGDAEGLLHSLRPDALVVDVDERAESAAAYARRGSVPLPHVSLRDRRLRVLEADGWRDDPGSPSPDALRNAIYRRTQP